MAAMIHRTVTIAPHLPRRCPEPRDFDARTGRDEPDSRAAEPAWPKAPTSEGRLAAGRPPHREVNRDHDRIHGHPGQPQMRPLPQHRTIGSSGHRFPSPVCSSEQVDVSFGATVLTNAKATTSG